MVGVGLDLATYLHGVTVLVFFQACDQVSERSEPRRRIHRNN